MKKIRFDLTEEEAKIFLHDVKTVKVQLLLNPDKPLLYSHKQVKVRLNLIEKLTAKLFPLFSYGNRR